MKKPKKVKRNRIKYDATYRKLHRERLSKQSRIYRKNNLQKYRDIRKKYRINNVEKVRLSEERYWKKHSEQRAASSAKRRALKNRATPVWANHEKVKAFYMLSKIFSNWTGIKYHVDHIVPLNSALVCGLHVEYNLRVITAKKNIIKSNKFWPDMPDTKK